MVVNKSKWSFGLVVFVLLASFSVFVLTFKRSLNKEPQEVYSVYLDGKMIGNVLSKDSFEDFINTREEELKKKYKVDNVYTPKGVEIKKNVTYSSNVDTDEDIYNKIISNKKFTIDGVEITITDTSEEEKNKTEKIYVLSKDIFDKAIENTILAFVDKEQYDKIAKGLNYLPCYDDNILVDPTSEYNGVLYPQDLFDYIYAVLHSPSYRERYKEFLKIDFPRIPYPTDWEKFRDLAEKGEELRQLHLMEDLPNSTGVSFPVGGTLQVDCYRWQDNRVYINEEQYFEGVPESAWNFYIGGYQPAQKWLKDRKGMTLSFEDVKHYQGIIYVLQQTGEIMDEIDGLMTKEK